MHFVVRGRTAAGDLKPLCGEWRGYPNWTTVPECVTCPFCLELLRSGGA